VLNYRQSPHGANNLKVFGLLFNYSKNKSIDVSSIEKASSDQRTSLFGSRWRSSSSIILSIIWLLPHRDPSKSAAAMDRAAARVPRSLTKQCGVTLIHVKSVDWSGVRRSAVDEPSCVPENHHFLLGMR
jgi:hypothetical protein